MLAWAALPIHVTNDGIGCADHCDWLDISHRNGFRCFLFGIDDARQIPRILATRRVPSGPLRCAECIESTGPITNETETKTL